MNSEITATSTDATENATTEANAAGAPSEPVSGGEPGDPQDGTAEGDGTADEAAAPPAPVAVAEATEQLVAMAQALADIGTALAEGNITAALDGIEKVREPAAQARRVLKAAARGKKPRARRSPGTGVRPGALRDLVQDHLYASPGEEFTPHQISKTLVRSSGAVANALDRLAQLGIAVPTSEKPRRFQLSPTAPPRPAPADDDALPAADEPATGIVAAMAEVTADAA